MRQIVLDTETTGLETRLGHRVIEIGCIEVVNRRMTGNTYHQYINPERDIDEAAIEVHGITLDMLKDKPRFEQIAEELLGFLRGAELIIHNAPFDVGFLNYEFALANLGENLVDESCSVLDSLVMARHKHPGQKNSLDALCKRYGVDNSQRELHGALLDAEILADVYLLMTGGQISLLGESEDLTQGSGPEGLDESDSGEVVATPVIRASEAELAAHGKWLELLEKESPGNVIWNRIESGHH